MISLSAGLSLLVQGLRKCVTVLRDVVSGIQEVGLGSAVDSQQVGVECNPTGL